MNIKEWCISREGPDMSEEYLYVMNFGLSVSPHDYCSAPLLRQRPTSPVVPSLELSLYMHDTHTCTHATGSKFKNPTLPYLLRVNLALPS